MVYIWGNYNTSGVTGFPAGGPPLNYGGYMGAQVPSSIVCDAFFPLSKTWFDGVKHDISRRNERSVEFNRRTLSNG
jgi:hypothetical protein